MTASMALCSNKNFFTDCPQGTWDKMSPTGARLLQMLAKQYQESQLLKLSFPFMIKLGSYK
jgi:hypothetical protein